VYDIVEDRFTVTNPCIVYKDGTAKVTPGNSKTYFFTEDLAYQLQKKVDEVNIQLQSKNVCINIYSKSALGHYEEASFRDYSISDGRNHAKNFLVNTVLVLCKLPTHEDAEAALIQNIENNSNLKGSSLSEAMRARDRNGSKTSMFINGLKSNINLITLSLWEIFNLKLSAFENKKDHQQFESIFKSINPVHNISYVNKPEYDYRKLVKMIAEKTVNGFVNSYTELNSDINSEEEFQAEMAKLSIEVSKIEYLASRQSFSSYSSSSDSINIQIPAGHIITLLKSFPKIEKYLKEKNIMRIV
jgi:hypothetical protein